MRTIEIFNKKSQLIETKLYDSINGNLLTVLTSIARNSELKDWYKQQSYFNYNDIRLLKYGDLDGNGIAEDAVVLVGDDNSSIRCYIFIKYKDAGFIKEAENSYISILRDSINIEFIKEGFIVKTNHRFEHQWERSVSFKRKEQKWYLDKDIFINENKEDFIFLPKKDTEFADFDPKENLPEELGIRFDNENEDRNLVVVSSVQELLDSIDDQTTIFLRPGEYNLSIVNDYKKRTTEEGIVDNQIRSIKDPIDENRNSSSQLFIYDVNNLSIIGLGKVKVTTDQDYASVIEFQNCYNILLENIESYHNAKEYTCSAPVISFAEGKHSRINYCIFNGSGQTGIELYNSKKYHSGKHYND